MPLNFATCIYKFVADLNHLVTGLLLRLGPGLFIGERLLKMNIK